MEKRESVRELFYSFMLILALSSCGIVGNGKFEDLSNPESTLIELSPTDAIETDENNRQAVFTVVLKAKPLSLVEVPISSSNEEEGTVDRTTLLFTTENWDLPQTVTVTGVDDDVVDGDQAYKIMIGAGISEDAAYEGGDPPDLDVVNHDNDSEPSDPPVDPGSVRAEINLPPEVISIKQRGLGSKVTLEAVVSDDKTISEILFEWEVDGTPAGSTNPMTMNEPDEGAVITLTVTDKAGASAIYTFYWGRDG